jgi:hypothetical protein
MEHQLSVWHRLIAMRIVYIMLGFVIAGLALWCYIQYGKEVAFQMYKRACDEKPSDLDKVNILFAKSHKTLIPAPDGYRSIRYRFVGGSEIDVLYNKEWQVVRIFPTFTSDGYGLIWLLHRHAFMTVSKTIPFSDKGNEDTGSEGPGTSSRP